MKPIIHILAVLPIALALAACEPQNSTPTNKQSEAQKAQQAAESIAFVENAEIDNIKRRIELTSKPGAIGFIVLMNEAGQPIVYEGVHGKVTSGSKRLTQPSGIKYQGNGNGGYNMAVVPTPSDEGTWGSSNEYIFYWNQDGAYRQWNGKYMYSDQPFRLRIQPLVIADAKDAK